MENYFYDEIKKLVKNVIKKDFTIGNHEAIKVKWRFPQNP